jgi:hypothetical protein
VLDHVGAGIFGVAPLVIADIVRGTGRYNLAQGAIATVQGIGASLSAGRRRGRRSLRMQRRLSHRRGGRGPGRLRPWMQETAEPELV